MATAYGIEWNYRGNRALDITIVKGATVVLPLTISLEGTPIDWTGYTGTATIKESLPDGATIVSFTVSLPNPTDGTWVLTLTDEQTAALTTDSCERTAPIGYWLFTYEDSLGETQRLFDGTVSLRQ